MRRAARTDDNQKAIVAALQKMGCTVLDLSMVGDGCPDLAVGRCGRTIWVEVKNGEKSPSRRKLRPSQKDWHSWWQGGPVHVVCTVEQAVWLMGEN